MDLEQWRAAPGTLLAAWPDLKDPNFTRTVILVCEHRAQGAFGLVVNRPLGLGLHQLVPDHPLLGGIQVPVFLGGPVDHSRLQFVHRLPEEIPGGHRLAEGLYLGGEVEALASALVRRTEGGTELARNIRLFLGYAGWSGGQLEEELIGGSWVPAPPQPGLVFEAADEGAWRQVLASIEGGPGPEPDAGIPASN